METLKKFKSNIRSGTARDTGYLLIGTVISNIFSLAVITLLTRSLDPAGFGLFITALIFAQMLADFSELGVNPGSLNYIAKANYLERKQYLKASFLLRLISTGLIVTLVFLFSGQFADLVFKNEDFIFYIQISAIGAVFLAFVSWAQNIYQSEGKFLLSSFINTSTNIWRLLVISILLFFELLTPISGYESFQYILVLAVLIFFITHDLGFLKVTISKRHMVDIIKFGLPIGLGFSLASIYTRLDQLLVFNLLGSVEAGYYGLATRLILILVFVVSSFGASLAPRFARMAVEDFSEYFKKSFYVTLGLVGITLVSVCLAPVFIPLVFGSKFIPSVQIFQILAIGMIFFILSIPLNLFLVFRNQKNMFVLIVGGLSLCLTWLLLKFLIPLYGINGAAISVALVNLFQFLAYLSYIYAIKKEK